MQITRAADCATRVRIYMASLPPSVKVHRVAIAKATDVPESFLSELMQRLVNAGLVASSQGSGGGFALAVPRGSVSLLDILEAIEGETRLNLCLADGPSCDRESWCPAHAVWQEAPRALANVLRRVSLSKLAQVATANAAQRLEARGGEGSQIDVLTTKPRCGGKHIAPGEKDQRP